MESSFRAQISTVQCSPSLAYIFVCLFKASTRLVPFVVLSSQKEASEPAEMLRGLVH